MNFHGLIHPFPVNRPLTELEIQRRLKIDKPSQSKPRNQLSVIKMNSTFLECVDKFHKEKGIISAASLTFMTIFAAMGLSALFFALRDWPSLTPSEKKEEIIFLLIVILVCFAFVAFFWFKIFKYEFRRFTHYPMRFNRKNRMVYVTRLDGSVMMERWDKLFFVLADLETADEGMAEARLHRLAEDGKTVLETFALARYGDLDNENVCCQWEFIRRYMEKGPKALMDDVSVVMDIADRRETFWDGYAMLAAEDAIRGWDIALFPVNFWYALGRWVAMHTSKIPVWPPEVEAECQIDPDDPYIRDRDNLAEPWDRFEDEG